MSLAIFDLDNTLINGDSDYEWGQFLVENGIVDGKEYGQQNARFYEQYKAGTLDILAFLSFSLQPLAEHNLEQLNKWHVEFMQQKILPMIGDKARALVEKHRDINDTLLIITATNRFVTAPIAREFNVEHLLATDLEIINGRYTGKVAGVPCFQHGKVERLQSWLDTNQLALDDSWFYSDSHNDLPLLNLVKHPVVVSPDAPLETEAKRLQWPILTLY